MNYLLINSLTRILQLFPGLARAIAMNNKEVQSRAIILLKYYSLHQVNLILLVGIIVWHAFLLDFWWRILGKIEPTVTSRWSINHIMQNFDTLIFRFSLSKSKKQIKWTYKNHERISNKNSNMLYTPNFNIAGDRYLKLITLKEIN